MAKMIGLAQFHRFRTNHCVWPAVYRTFIIAVASFSLSNCVDADGSPLQTKPADTAVLQVNGTKITVGGAEGFCVNSRPNRKTSAGAFIIFSPCAPGKQKGGAPATSYKSLMIASVSSNELLAKATNQASLASFFRTDEGLKSLSNSGNASTVQILKTRKLDGVYYIHTRDTAGPLIPDTTSEQWRGFFVVSDRLVSISTINFIDNPTPSGLVLLQLEEFAARIKTLNAKAE